MSDTSIFNDALLDAKKLRSIAEDNAKNALVEAITPRIREMIEKQLLGEDTDASSDVFTEVADELLGDNTENLSEGSKSKKDILLNEEGAKILASLLEGRDAVKEAETLEGIKEKYDRVTIKLQLAKELAESNASRGGNGKQILDRLVTKMLSESKTLENDVIGIVREGSYGNHAAMSSEIQKVRKEIVEMASRKQKLKESNEVFNVDLAELGLNESDIEDDDMDMDMDDEVEDDDMDVEDDMDMDMDVDDEEGGDVEIPEDLAQQLLDVLQGSVDDDMDDEEMDMDDMDMDDEDDDDMEDDEEDDDEVVEIDEAMLKRELARMRSSLDEGDGVTDFGGAKKDREAFVDSDDSNLNVHDTLKKKLKKENRQNRVLRNQVSGLKKVTSKLREHLEQMNLFNSKLLYVNKLMQNESISKRSLKSIVETVDKAKTLREVRLIYKTVNESASGKRRKTASSLNEGGRRSSSSRASRGGGSSRTLSEGSNQTERWATLAGIKNNK